MAIARWNEDAFEVPDVIGFKDYVTCSKAVAACLKDSDVDEPGPLLPFPYPKSNNSLRWLHIATPEDLILLRVAAGRVVRLTDGLLSPRVYSNRLNRRFKCWRFHDTSKRWSQFRRHAISLLDGRRHSTMYRTDIAGYYPSVDMGRLSSLLEERGCLNSASRVILKVFRAWQLRDGLRGIPVGPEVSAVIGNFFLSPLDSALERNGHQHLRWGDDILTFGSTLTNCQNSEAVIDEVLSELQLMRSVAKTRRFGNVLDARSNVEDYLLTSLTELLKLEEGGDSTSAVRRAFDEQLLGNSEVNPSRFRWIIKTLRHRRDSYGCLPLARTPSLMNVDPKVAAEYLREVALSSKLKVAAVVDAILRRLSAPQEDQFDGLDLHLLSAVLRRRLGDAEAKEFRSIATDVARRWPIRVYAWAAYIKTTQRYEELTEAANEEKIPQLRRGMVASLKGQAKRSFLTHVRSNFPESRYVADWLHAA